MSINIGPRVLVRKVNSASSALIWVGDFSGNSMPGTIRASWSLLEPSLNCSLQAAAASAMLCSSSLCQSVSNLSSKCSVYIPRTSSFSTFNLLSSTSRPSRSSSLVLSRSLRAVATTGALVVCRACLASAKPMPREAGDTSDHGGMFACQSRNGTIEHDEKAIYVLIRVARSFRLDAIYDAILGLSIG